jgi:ATP-dependent RNA helicase DDX54/DBP10
LLYQFDILKDLFSAVTIYSTLDHSTRKFNLAKYQTGQTRILIVTDIAARGLDIPSLDNVINYHFPATPKLFLHRVGRVARAGRMGTAYSLISTDELAYLYDVQEFIGKTIQYATSNDNNNDNDYHLLFGNVPQTIIDEELETIRKLTDINIDLINLFQVQQNAYQHYLRTRPPSTYASVKQMKQYNHQIINMAIHPIFKEHYTAEDLTPNGLIEQLKSFRAKNTIFEVNPSAGNTACTIMKRKRAHDEKLIFKYNQKDQPLPEINQDNDQQTKTLEVDNMTITIQGTNESDDNQMESPKKKKKKNRREVDKEFFIPYQPPDFKRERGLEIQSFERQTNESVMDLTNDDGTPIRGPTIQKTKWDRKKKKFVTVGQNDAKTKKIKTESGQWIQASYKTDVYKKWLNKSKTIDKELPDSRRNKSEDHIQHDEISSAQTKPKQFQQRVKQLMNREKSQLKAKGQSMPSHSELKKPEQIVKKRAETSRKQSLQRARQMRKGGRTNYKNKRHSTKPKYARRAPSNTNNSPKRTKKK